MDTITGTLRGGRIVPDVPVDWPEGTRVEINRPSGAGKIGIDEAEALVERSKSNVPETPEEIEDWLRWYHALEPLEFTPEEESDLAAWRQKIKEYSIAKDQHKEELFP